MIRPVGKYFKSVSLIIRENSVAIKSYALFFTMLIAFDQVTKLIAQSFLENSASVTLIPDLLKLHFIRNEIQFLHQYVIYGVINLIVMPAVIIYSIDKKYNRLVMFGLLMLWSAVFSNNIIDAFSLGYIRDFIQLHGVATGNVADQYRTIGVVLLITGLFIQENKKVDIRLILKIALTVIIILVLIMLYWRYLARFNKIAVLLPALYR